MRIRSSAVVDSWPRCRSSPPWPWAWPAVPCPAAGQRTATAVFTDVGDLANGAQVQLADVPVGSVRSIALEGDKAKVTLAFDDGVRIPADVSAAIDRTHHPR